MLNNETVQDNNCRSLLTSHISGITLSIEEFKVIENRINIDDEIRSSIKNYLWKLLELKSTSSTVYKLLLGIEFINFKIDYVKNVLH